MFTHDNDNVAAHIGLFGCAKPCIVLLFASITGDKLTTILHAVPAAGCCRVTGSASLLPMTTVSAAGCRRVTGSAPLLPVTTVSAAGCSRVLPCFVRSLTYWMCVFVYWMNSFPPLLLTSSC